MVKVISLSNEAYIRLKTMKGNKSFSDIVVELVEEKRGKRKKSIMEFVGLWKEDADYWENFKKKIRESRNKARLREVKF
ncbi:MAG: antitoxin VapB family protein [Nanoarchaeota archaeon]